MGLISRVSSRTYRNMDLFTIKRKDSKNDAANMFSSIPSLEDTFTTKTNSKRKDNTLKVKIDLPAAQPSAVLIPDRKLLNQELYVSSKSIQSGVNADIDLSSLSQFRLPEKMVRQCYEQDRVMNWDELFTQVNTLIKSSEPKLPEVKIKSKAFDF